PGRLVGRGRARVGEVRVGDGNLVLAPRADHPRPRLAASRAQQPVARRAPEPDRHPRPPTPAPVRPLWLNGRPRLDSPPRWPPVQPFLDRPPGGGTMGITVPPAGPFARTAPRGTPMPTAPRRARLRRARLLAALFGVLAAGLAAGGADVVIMPDGFTIQGRWFKEADVVSDPGS